MNRNNYSKKQSSAVKPYCKVCHDAGKSEKEYTSHFVKSAPGPEGKVVCPTLLSQSCGFCGACGHTPKFCKVLAEQKVAEEKALKQAARREAVEKREAEKAKPAQPSQKKQSSNIFDAFGSDSDTETKPKVSKKVSKPEKMPAVMFKPATKAVKIVATTEEFPALPQVQSRPTEAAAAANPVKKTEYIKNALAKVYPEIVLADKMPEVNTYRPPMATLVRNKPATQEAAQAEEEESEPEDWMISDYVDMAFARAPSVKASELDWAMEDDESSDEEDW